MIATKEVYQLRESAAYGYKIYENGVLHMTQEFNPSSHSLMTEEEANAFADEVLEGYNNCPEPQPEPQAKPTTEDYLIDLDFRLTCIELGL